MPENVYHVDPWKLSYTCYVEDSTVVSRKYAPLFATLASVQNAGGAYTRDATISLAITPPLPVPIKHDLIVGGR